MAEAKTTEYPRYVPTGKELEVKIRVEADFEEMLKVRRRPYRQLGGRTLQQYWNESEKRFLSYPPPRELTEEEWQANFVMGLTRNAVLSNVGKVGSRIPEAKFRAVMKDGISDTDDSLLLRNYYRYSIRRERADRLQVFNSLGAFTRGNSAWFEGWEDFEGEVDLIIDVDFETGEVKTDKKTMKRFGPKRRTVPVNEIFYKNIYCNDLRDNDKVTWRQVITLADFKKEFGKYKNAKYVVPGNPVGTPEDRFFKPSANLGQDLVEVRREYNSVLSGGIDQVVYWANGVVLSYTVLPFNHKMIPIAWCITEPMDDEFLIGLSVPFKVLAHQDSGDGFWNTMLDRQTLFANRPILTTADDPDMTTHASPNAIVSFPSRNGDGTTPTIMPMPIEGISNSDLALFERIVQMGKEDSGSYGGATAASPEGGKVTARQAQMMQEEAKRLLGIPMGAIEFQERDLAALRAMNFIQFTRGSEERIEIEDALLRDGRRGRVIVHFPNKPSSEATALKPTLDDEEMSGEKSGEPTEAMAVPTDWYDMVDRVEAAVETDSSYMTSKALDSALFDQKVMTAAMVPQIAERSDWDAVNREFWKKDGLDPDKFTAKQAPMQAQQEGEQQPAPAAAPSGRLPQQAQPPGLAQLMEM
jgi:hypothetical protein